MTIEEIKSSNSLEELLERESLNGYPDTFGKKSHIERYKELAAKFKNYPVEMGAMKECLEDWIRKAGEISNSEGSREERMREYNEHLENNPIIFLNRHDESHTKKVMERALELIKCCDNAEFSNYEMYFLACAIVVHDIGNIYGRIGHEKRIADMLNNGCEGIIPDSLERRIISRIAGVHGGKIGGNLDTISILNEDYAVNGFHIKERLLAAILRFADELADDYTRANYDAMDAQIIGKASEIYHVYSEKLHTVEIRRNEITDTNEVFLAYQFDKAVAQRLYGEKKQERYLIDEIYSRTLKMERERRYCIRYLRPYCSLERIIVEIVVTKDTFDEEKIRYTLEEKGYPAMPFSTIKDVGADILSGEELATKLKGEQEE